MSASTLDRHGSPGSPVARVATLISVPLAPGSGLGSFLIGLFDTLAARGTVDMTLIAPPREQGAAGRRWSQVLMGLRQIAALFRARPDLVHVHDHPALLATAVAYRLLAPPGTRIVFSSHLDPAGARSWWKRRLMGWLFQRCAAVTVVCRDSIAKLSYIADPLPPPDVVRVVPGAATVHTRGKSDPEVVSFGAQIGVNHGPVLLQVSNFVYPAKVEGTLRLIEAFAQVRAAVPAAHLIVLGTGPLVSRALAERDRLALADAVTIPAAFVPDLSIPAGLADVHCHITGQDACPISILEAMHAGKPIVASRTGGIPEIIDDGVTGILVDDDPEHIAAAIVGLLTDRASAEAMGRRARGVAETRFTWERVADDVESLYRRPAVYVGAARAEVEPLGR
jgi:glycosyltransferase involved in cell wall biosynthesis